MNCETCSNLPNGSVSTAFIEASQNGHLDEVRELLRITDLDLNIRDEFNNTALILASQKGYCDIVCELLKHDGVDVNAKNRDGTQHSHCRGKHVWQI
jgi:ankyrin repeat domain-containing protein 50